MDAELVRARPYPEEDHDHEGRHWVAQRMDGQTMRASRCSVSSPSSRVSGAPRLFGGWVQGSDPRGRAARTLGGLREQSRVGGGGCWPVRRADDTGKRELDGIDEEHDVEDGGAERGWQAPEVSAGKSGMLPDLR